MGDETTTEPLRCRAGHEMAPANTYTRPRDGRTFCRTCKRARRRGQREADRVRAAAELERLKTVKAECQKSRRGVAIWREAPQAPPIHIAVGTNYRAEGSCDLSEACRRDCSKICIHAEEAALRMWRDEPTEEALSGGLATPCADEGGAVVHARSSAPASTRRGSRPLDPQRDRPGGVLRRTSKPSIMSGLAHSTGPMHDSLGVSASSTGCLCLNSSESLQ